jgi:hypothetical protein
MLAGLLWDVASRKRLCVYPPDGYLARRTVSRVLAASLRLIVNLAVFVSLRTPSALAAGRGEWKLDNRRQFRSSNWHERIGRGNRIVNVRDYD